MGRAQALEGLRDGEVQLDRQKVKKGASFSRPVGNRANPEAMPPWWFHPQRWEAQHGAPLDMEPMRVRLKSVDPRLDISWHPLREVFQVWLQKPSVTFFACPGWKRIAMHAALDDRLLWAIRSWQENHEEVFTGQQSLDVAYGRVQAAIDRDQRAIDARDEDEAEMVGRECYDYGLIKVGYGASSGSKFADSQVGG